MPESKRLLKVFLSYASQDRPAVRELYECLKKEDWIDPWLDQEKLSLGQHWTSVIEDALDVADAVIIFLSSNSVQKEGFVQRELNYAWEISLEKPRNVIFLIPFRLDNCEVPRYLRSRHWGDYFGEKKEETYDSLLKSLKLRYEQKIKLDAEEQARKEKAEKERIAFEEKAHKDAEEKAHFEAEERARRAREEQEREVAEAKAQKEKLEREREVAERLAQENIAAEKAPRIGGENQKQDYSPPLSQVDQATSKTETAAKRKPTIPIFVTAIGVLAVVLTALWNSPFFRKQDTPTPSPTVTDTKPVSTQTSEPSITPTVTLAMTSTLLPAEIQDAKGILMHLVSAGEFTMGFSADQANGFCQTIQSNVPWSNTCYKKDYLSEEPVHQVSLNSFFVDVYEVSNGEYQKCATDRVCAPPSKNSANRYSNYYPSEAFRSYPVIYVTWDMAKTYCEWRGARLPTEAEWEKAARGTDARTYPWENYNPAYKLYEPALYKNKANLSLGDVNKATMPVDSNSDGLSPYGLYNMAGNVWEWVEDWYSDTYYASSPLKNPPGPEQGQYRVIRGGGANSSDIRTTVRGYMLPTDSNSVTGFRCAKDANP